jgi:DNA-binding transcriptional LysR family regulator
MHILPIVTDLMRRYDKLVVRLMLSDRVVRLVEEGIDVAVRIAELSDSTLHAVRLAEVRRPLVASPDYLARRGEPRQVADLQGHDLIVFDRFAPSGEWRFTAEGRPAIRCEPRLLTDSVEASVGAAVAGAGIARVLSYQVADHVREGRLRYVLEPFEPPAWPVHLLFQAHRRRTPNVGAFIAAAQAYCRGRSFTGCPGRDAGS